MTSPLKGLFARYKAYHQHGPLLLHYLSLLGLIGFPLLYAVRFVRPTAGYDDFAIRMFDTAICLLLFLRHRWPERLKPLYMPYSYAVVIITLPLTFAFTSLKHGGNAAAVGNTFFAVFLLMLLADWRNMVVMLITGFAIGGTLYGLTDPNPHLPKEYVARLPLLLTSIVGGSMFKYALEQATAERVRQAYASLAGSIAHEMRNPMAQVRHSLEHIRQALPIPGHHQRQHLVDRATIEGLYKHVAQGELAVNRGLQVIAMTLDQVNAKPIDPKRFDYLSAAEVSAKAIAEYGYENEQLRARVSLDVEKDFTFRGEETAFLFVLFNLLKNSLYYVSAKPEMRITVTVAEGTIRVRDTGPGIPAEVAAQLFKPFGTSGKAGGTGLGLAYCQRVMEAFGGSIRCESVPGESTEFIIGFPAVDAREVEARRLQTMVEARRAFADRRVLLVDDDAALRSATRQKLLALCCTVREAADGVEAVEALRESAFDLVILDLNMPRMDGYEVAETVRSGALGNNRDVCLVAHSSEPAHLARVKTANTGFDGFAPKPCDAETLVQVMRTAMDARAQARARGRGWLEGRRFLLADDNAYNRAAVGAYLRHAGAEVVEVGSGQAALDAARDGAAFDALLLDIHMPVLDGVETARGIRQGASASRAAPILAITAHAGAELVERAKAAGIDDFVTKPVEPAVLFDRLAVLFGIGTPAMPLARPASASAALLDVSRLEGYHRIGMLEELIDEYVPGIEALIERLHAAVRANDRQATVDALHSLVGMSGEAGALALYRYSREIYIPMLEREAWPADPDWIGRIDALTERTNNELRAWIESHRARPADEPQATRR
ncbi:response regulator [Ramlibacter sp.]|uniref:response regulator n=1 Tax=Ramlibacter sp. TaxID=1917967 RepID=UPI003D0B106C